MLANIKLKIILVTALFVLGGGSFYFILVSQDLGRVNRYLMSRVEPAVASGVSGARRLNGEPISGDKENFLPVAVMIENFIAARPISGLSEAQVVYETLAEADITRFLAVYDLADEVKKIGPVRSARPYFIDLASEYGALYIHSGGSAAALERLNNEKGVTDLNEFFGYNSGYFWRISNRSAPHNLYTSSELLLTAEKNYKLTGSPEFRSWLFKDESPNQATTTAGEIKIDFSLEPDYQVVWQYNKTKNQYDRYQNNRRHKDDDGALINAKNVVIQVTPMKVLDAIGRKEFDLADGGRATVFQDGLVIEGSWRKENGRTIFYDKNNREIKFNRGPIWIEIVPDISMVSY